MLELLTVFSILLLAIAASLWRRAQAPTAAPATSPPDPIAAAWDQKFGFIRAFGLHPKCLKELHVYAAPGRLHEFPEKVIEILTTLHRDGKAIGAPIMALLHQARPLREDEAVYVAVMEDTRSKAQHIVAFVDRKRHEHT